MRIKTPQNGDLSKVKEVLYPGYEKEFELPDDRHCVRKFIVVPDNTDDIIAYACFNNVLEATLMLHPKLDKRFKIEILDKLIEYARTTCEELGYDWFYSFVKNNEAYAKILKKNYGFKDSNGKCLYLGV
jgi:competence transcription factor ComK